MRYEPVGPTSKVIFYRQIGTRAVVLVVKESRKEDGELYFVWQCMATGLCVVLQSRIENARPVVRAFAWMKPTDISHTQILTKY